MHTYQYTSEAAREMRASENDDTRGYDAGRGICALCGDDFPRELLMVAVDPDGAELLACVDCLAETYPADAE